MNSQSPTAQSKDPGTTCQNVFSDSFGTNPGSDLSIGVPKISGNDDMKLFKRAILGLLVLTLYLFENGWAHE